MEKISRILTAAMLAIFGLLLGLALLLGGCQPEHLSYCVACALGVVGAGLYTLWQRRPRPPRTICERLGSGTTAFLLLCLCVLVNLGWVLYFRADPVVDYQTWKAAVELSAGQPLSDRVYIAMFPHLLGYSTFLSLFVRLFGPVRMVAKVLNVCLVTLSGFFMYRLMLRWRGPNSAALVLLAWSLFPSKMFYNTIMLSEPYYTCLLLETLWIASEVEAGRPRLFPAMLLGLFAGLLLRLVNTARPIAAVPIAALLIWVLLLCGDRDRQNRVSWLGFSAALLAVYLLTGPLWNAYLERVLEEPPASVTGYSLYVGVDPVSLGNYSQEDMDLLLDMRSEPDSSAELVQREMLELFKERLHSGLPFGKLFFTKLRTFLGFDEGGAFSSRIGLRDRAYQLLALYSNIWYYALGILTLWGGWRLLRSDNRKTVLLVPLYVIGLTLLQMLTEVAARYHYSIIPMLILMAGFSYTRPVAVQE